MKKVHFLPFAAALVMTIAPLTSQGQTATEPVPPPAPAKSTDCAKPTMKRHDHGAERGAGSTAGQMQAKPCAPDPAASAAKATKRKVPPHDHGKSKNL